MATATTLTVKAPETTEAPAVRRGWPNLPCPKCGEVDGCRIDLAEVTGDEAITCASCEECFGVDFLRDLVERWQPVLSWLSQVPALPDEE